MPAFPLEEKDLNDLTSYILSLKSGTASEREPVKRAAVRELKEDES
jgi:mono/diheme cytochrome c family protein